MKSLRFLINDVAARPVCSILRRWTVFEQSDHLESCFCTLAALIANIPTCTVYGLFQRLTSQETEKHRQILRKSNFHQGQTYTSVYMLIVRCLATNDCPQGNHGHILPRLGHSLGNDRKFPGPGDPRNIDMVVGNTCFCECLPGSVQ